MGDSALLEIRDLHAGVGDVQILKGVSLIIRPGEVHAIMGRNGSGKSTLANIVVGHPLYTVTSGQVLFHGKDLLKLAPEERARVGVFLSFQHPIEISGVRLDHFLRAGFNAINKSKGLEELDPLKFDRFLNRRAKIVGMESDQMKRSVNEGFSGGERKRNEILQMSVLEPKLAILDEPDSGLDIDALRTVAEAIDQQRSSEKAIILVTHYQRILNYIIPDVVNVLVNGRIAKTGGKELAMEIEAKGYDWLETPEASFKASS